MKYEPSSWGARFHALKTHEALGGGSAGPGKTTCLIADPSEQIAVEHTRCFRRFDPANPIMANLVARSAHGEHLPEDKRAAFAAQMPSSLTLAESQELWDRHCYHEWGSSVGEALHLRRLAKSMGQSIEKFRGMFQSIDPKMHWSAADNQGTFSSGFKYTFGHCKDPDDYMGYETNQYTYVGWDELNQFLENQYDRVNARVRSSDWVLRSMLKRRAMSNPTIVLGKGDDFTIEDPFWVRKRFVDPAPQGNVILKKRIKLSSGKTRFYTQIYVPALLSDNPDRQFAEEHELSLRTLKPHLRQALLGGDWYVTAGAFFSDAWSTSLHVCKPFKIPEDWKVYRCMDWGFKTPGVIYWSAEDPDGTLWVFREYTFQGKTASQVAERAREIEKDEGLFVGGRSTSTGPADTQIFERRGDRAIGKDREFAKFGFFWSPADKSPGARARNAELLIERFTDHGDGAYTPGIVFFDTCKKAMQTIPSIPTDPHDPNVPMKGGSDHWLDAILYLCAFVSRETAPRRGDDEEDLDDDEPRESVDYGRDGYGSTA